MSHLDEMTCLLFLERQLDRGQILALETHLHDCPACGTLLHALKQESRVLGQSLLEEDEPLPARLRTLDRLSKQELPSRASAPWVPWAWALSFGLAAAACYAAWTDVLQPWLDQMDQAGFQGSSLLIRLVVSGALWANSLGASLVDGGTIMWNTLQYALLSSLGVGALALLRYRKSAAWAIVVGGFAALLGVPAPAAAAEVRRGPDITVPTGETVANDLIATGARVRVDGTVNGDLIAFSQSVIVNGHVTGDVIAFGDMTRLDGPVDGNVRCFCNTLDLESSVGKNITAFAARVELSPKAAVGGGITAFVRNLIVDGKVGRDLLLFSADTTINGAVGGDVLLRGARLSVGPAAAIAGSLQVTGDRRPDVAEGAKLGRPLEFQNPPRRPGRFRGFYLLRQIVGYGVALLCGLLLIKLFPGLFAAAHEAARRVGLAMSVGALILITGMALVIFSLLLLLAGAAAGIATMALYVPILYGSQVFVGAWIGEKLTGKSSGGAPSIGHLALGLLVLRVLGMIPFLGFFVWAAAVLWGAGAISMGLWNRTRLDPVPAAA